MGPDALKVPKVSARSPRFKTLSEGILFLTFLCLSGCVHGHHDRDTVFQNAPLAALMAGCYDGTMSIKSLKEHGDFGLGTLDALDGEMVVLDGVFYQIKPDGKAYLLGNGARSPFAAVTFFDRDQVFSVAGEMSLEDLKRFLDGKLRSSNLLYAVRVDGSFKSLKVRSAAPQKKPYPVLTEAIHEQKVFELKDQEGTLVGFRFPAYMGGVNVPGYHFHFLSKDRTVGGHVLDLLVKDPGVAVDEAKEFSMKLPENAAFLKFDLKGDPEAAIAQVEK